LATQLTPPTEQIFHIPLADIQLSKTNPRSDIDEEELERLKTLIARSKEGA